MVYGRSLQDDCCNMYTILMFWYSLDPASEKETRESLNQEKEREREIGDRTLMLKRRSPVILS